MAFDKSTVNKELLINEVRERACLYDMTHKNYSRTDVKNNNWVEICNALEVDGTRGKQFICDDTSPLKLYTVLKFSHFYGHHFIVVL